MKQITVVDTATLSVVRIIKRTTASDFGTTANAVAMDPIHGHALVAGAGSDTVAVLDLEATAPVARRGGADRFAVSAAISATEFAPEVPVAYVASGGAFADALSGSAAAGTKGAPVLLVGTDGIPPVIAAELTRLKPKSIVILGGPASVGDAVQSALATFSPTVSRLSGTDRYEVSARISRLSFNPGLPVAYVASGAVFPDALSGSAIAANNGGPVLLVTKDGIPPAVKTELDRLRPGRIVVLGGANTISTSTENALKATAPTTRIAGADRFEVSSNASASNFSSGVNVAYVASGAVFPDALSGSPAAAANGAPVLLVTKDGIPASVAAELDRLNPVQIVVLGGPATISEATMRKLQDYLR